MIIGIGSDLVEIARIERALTRFGERFETRVFTANEIALARSRNTPAHTYAKRFAAKEAFVKARGTGLRGLQWRDIEITLDAAGKPAFLLHGPASLAPGMVAHLSLSDDAGFALAFVILESA